METLKKILKWIGIAVVAIAAIVFTLYLIYLRPVMKKMEQTSTITYDKGLTIITGGGGNSGILTSDSLVIVIDTKMGDASEQLFQDSKRDRGKQTDFSDQHSYSPGSQQRE